MLLHIIRSYNENQSSSSKTEGRVSVPSSASLQGHVAESYKMVLALYGPFKSKAKEQVGNSISYQ